MRFHSIFISSLAISYFALTVTACSNQKKTTTPSMNAITKTNDRDTLMYSYIGPSVAPQYHRRYTIRVTAGQVYLAISDYSNILSEDSTLLTPEAWKNFAQAINDLHIKNGKESNHGGCTGGHTESLELYPGTSNELKGYTYFCGGQQFGNLEGDIPTAAKLFQALVPGLAGKIEATRKN